MNNKFDTDSPWEWEQLPTTELESMLQIELKKEIPNDDIVLLILHILEKREQDEPIRLTRSEQTAFGRYKQKILNRQKKSYVFQRWISIAASVALIIGLMFSMFFYKTNNILPCVICHSIINITNTFLPSNLSNVQLYIGWIAFILPSVFYTWYLYKTKKSLVKNN